MSERVSERERERERVMKGKEWENMQTAINKLVLTSSERRTAAQDL